MSNEAALYLLRDYIYEMQERVSEASGNTDFDRGYDMGLQSALDNLLGKIETFGLKVEIAAAINDKNKY